MAHGIELLEHPGKLGSSEHLALAMLLDANYTVWRLREFKVVAAVAAPEPMAALLLSLDCCTFTFLEPTFDILLRGERPFIFECRP